MNWLGGSLNEQLPNSKHVSGVDTVSTNANAAHTGKDTMTALVKSASVFVSYLSTSHDV
jgi:hypothetical protein